jgi:peptidoglycan hydrolase CwlO-like protein
MLADRFRAQVNRAGRSVDREGMTGDGSRVRARRLLTAVVAASVVMTCATPSGATPQARLEDARAQLHDLTSQIESAASTLQGLQEDLAAADVQVADATARLAELDAARERLRGQLDAARARYEQARARLSDIAATSFMQTSGSLDTTVLGAILGADTVQEASDRLAFSSAVADSQARAAADAEAARMRLEQHAAAVESVAAAQTSLLEDLRAARDARAAAVAGQSEVQTQLAASRDELVALIGRLGERVRAAEIGGVGRAFQGEYHVSYGEWADRFLATMGVSDCRSNRVVVVAWQVQEFTQAAWNPLATTHRMQGSTDFNSVGVQNFVSLEQGLQATKETIDHGWDVYRYGAIVDALARCADPMTTARAVNASSWCPGCTNGQYLVGLVPKVDADLASYASI